MLKLIAFSLLLIAGYTLLSAVTAFAYSVVKYCLLGASLLLLVSYFWPTKN